MLNNIYKDNSLNLFLCTAGHQKFQVKKNILLNICCTLHFYTYKQSVVCKAFSLSMVVGGEEYRDCSIFVSAGNKICKDKF